MANTTWSTTDKTNVTLSGANLIATTSGNGGVRAADRQITGRFYFEITATTWASNGIIGIANAGANLGTTATTLLNVAVLNFGGNLFVNGVSSGIAFGTRANGNVICIAVDITNQLLWVRIGAAGNWNTNASFSPGGTGGLSFAAIGGVGIPVYPVACALGSGSVFTANFGDAAFTGAVPSGFTSGFTAGANPPVNELLTQIAIEEWGSGTPNLYLTQIALEEWATVQTVTPQLVLTQIAIEEWASVAQVVQSRGGPIITMIN
jgi:hypothetical protein